MTTIYCDASCDEEKKLFVWACVVISENGKTMAYAGQYKPHKMDYLELMAIVKSLGKVKSHKGKIELFTDLKSIVDTMNNPQSKRINLHTYSEWTTLRKYLKQYKHRITLQYIPRKQNLAHNYAYAALNQLRKNKPLETCIRQCNITDQDRI